MATQMEPLDLSNKNGSKKLLSILDVKFLTDLDGHLARLYERRGFSEKKTGIARRNACSKNVLPCQVCSKSFDRPSLLKRHMRTHTGEKPHICSVCGKGFSTSSSLNTHKRIHTGEKPHKCPECGKCFTASSNLYYHRMTHTKNKPHKCTWCPRSFPTPGELRSHVTTHDLKNVGKHFQYGGENDARSLVANSWPFVGMSSFNTCHAAHHWTL